MKTPIIFVPLGIVIYILCAAIYQIIKYYIKKALKK